MAEVNLNDPLPAIQLEDGKTREAYLFTGIVGETVAMKLAHLVQVFEALTSEQRAMFVNVIGPDKLRDSLPPGNWLKIMIGEYDRIREIVGWETMSSPLSKGVEALKSRADRASSALAELQEAINVHLGWDDDERSKCGDYVENVRHAPERLRFPLETRVAKEKERADRAEARVRELERERHEVRLSLLDELYQAMGQLVADECCDKQGQHYGIASCREVVLARIAQLVKS